MMHSWPHQIRGGDMLRASFRSGKRAPILVISTGGGKTHCFCGYAEAAARKNRRVLILVHRHELLLSTSAKLDEYGLAHGLISPHYKQTTDFVQVASVQTLVRRLRSLRWKPDLIICDEAHLSAAPTYLKIFSAFPDAFIIGSTATPGRLDRKGLGKDCGGVYDDIVQPVTMRQLIDDGYLVKPRLFAPFTPDLSGVRQVHGDYDQHQLAGVMDKAALVGDVVSHWRRLAAGRPTLAFCVSIQHAQHMAEQFNAAGIPAKAISGETPMQERLDAIKALGDGRLRVVANCSLFIEGINQPCVSCIILLSPTKSLTRYLQSVGRGLRKFDGKADCIVLDHASCSHTHGMVDEDREWSLNGEVKRQKNEGEAAVARCRMCQVCYAVNPLWRNTCEQCAAPFEAQREPPKQTEGELVEITEIQREALRRTRRIEEGRAQTLEELQALGAARGYAPGWARIRWQARQHRRSA